ncbi:hypothetical protein G7Y89_g14054 [Cudoniella acicularis]|uniref:Uncharacterized protein n=1 Tax=Cudoniella acicularis TaxID=354080 RepID=A0A8H4VY31_9HELO|nr:hypothetical protein G7Y89_g14054 [Cudoniella acicularis]
MTSYPDLLDTSTAIKPNGSRDIEYHVTTGRYNEAANAVESLHPDLAQRLQIAWSLCSPERLAFPALVPKLNNSKYSDPRDVVYTLLNLRIEREKAIIIKPNYANTIGGVYQDFVFRYVKQLQELKVLRLCDLRRKRYDVPYRNDSKILVAGVPDLSNSALPRGFNRQFASGQSVGKAKYMGSGILRVTGVKSAIVKHAERANIRGNTVKDLTREIWRLAPTDVMQKAYRESLTDLKDGQHGIFFSSLQTFVENPQSDDQQLPESFNTPLSLGHPVVTTLEGWSFFTTNEGYIGLGLAKAQSGDIIPVLLGCKTPILLRRVEGGRYQVVGECSILGLKHSEALLGPIPSQCLVINEYYPDGT